MLEDLGDRKEELESSYSAALEYLRIEKKKSLDQYQAKLNAEIRERIKNFKRELAETLN